MGRSQSVTSTASSVTTHDGVRIATRDWRGNGPDLVLLHGQGPDQRSMRLLAAALTPAFRVITFDQRCCGESATGPWTFPIAVQDLQAVIEGLDLANPALVGHSLGGMIALMYAAEHRDVPAVVNLDGWGPGTPEQYVGEDPAAVLELQRQISELKPNSRFGRAALALVQRKSSVRRSKEMRDRVLADLWDLDVLALHRQVSCPVLAFNCAAPPSAMTRRILGNDAIRMMQSQRVGLRRDLDRLCAEHPNITVVDVDAPHMAPATRPDLFAEHIRAFLTDK